MTHLNQGRGGHHCRGYTCIGLLDKSLVHVACINLLPSQPVTSQVFSTFSYHPQKTHSGLSLINTDTNTKIERETDSCSTMVVPQWGIMLMVKGV